MSQDHEHYIAKRGGAEAAASIAYFDARLQIDTKQERKIFRDGFERAYDLREKELTDLRKKCAELEKDVQVAKGQYEGACIIAKQMEEKNAELQRQLDEAATNLPALIDQAIAEDQERIIGILYGIDKTEIEDEKGWWETSFGAKFGLSIIDAIRARKSQT